MRPRSLVKRVLSAAIALSILGACGGSGDDEESSSASTAAEATAATETSAESGDLTPVRLTLEWVIQTEFAGYYAALEQGYYADEGIDLTIQPGGPDVNPVQLLLSGDSDIVINSFGNALVARESGADVISIGQVFERSAYRLVSFADQGIDDPADFKGKTVGLWSGFSPSFSATVAKAGLDLERDITIYNQGFDMEALFNGDVDLASAMVYNEYAQALAGAGDREIAVFDFNEYGTNTLENALIVTREWAEANPEVAKGFVKATVKGWIYCREHPEACIDIVLEAGPALPRNYQTWQMNEVNKLIWPSTNGVLNLTPEMFQQTATILHEYGVIKEAASPDSYDMSYRDAAIAELEGEDLHGADFVPMELDPSELFAET